MKELSSHAPDNLNQVKQQNMKKVTFGGTLKIQPGHTAFEFDLVAKDIHPAEFEEINLDFAALEKGEVAKRKKLVMKPGCIYCSALNKPNAKKKFMKMLVSAVGE